MEFNLLRYPTAVRQQRLRQQLWAFLIGLVGSLLLAWVGLQWLAMSTGALRQDLRRLQAQVTQQQAQVKAAQQRVHDLQVRQRQQNHLTRVSQQQQALADVHAALQDEAPRSGLKFQRLQIESGRLELQALAPDIHSMGQTGERLSERLGQTLLVTGLNEVVARDEGASVRAGVANLAVAVTWQGTWPVLQTDRRQDAALLSGVGHAPALAP